MLVKPDDFITEFYPEILEQITRRNPTEVILQIKAAEEFCKGYLSKYDLKALFGTDDDQPTHPDENLKMAVKTIAGYRLVRKANPNTSVELFRDDWQLLIGTKSEPGWLADIQAGRVNPQWPYRQNDPETNPDESQENNEVAWYSNKKRTQSF